MLLDWAPPRYWRLRGPDPRGTTIAVDADRVVFKVVGKGDESDAHLPEVTGALAPVALLLALARAGRTFRPDGMMRDDDQQFDQGETRRLRERFHRWGQEAPSLGQAAQDFVVPGWTGQAELPYFSMMISSRILSSAS